MGCSKQGGAGGHGHWATCERLLDCGQVFFLVLHAWTAGHWLGNKSHICNHVACTVILQIAKFCARTC